MAGERDRSYLGRLNAGLGRAGRALAGSKRRAGLLSAVTVATAVALVPAAGSVASGSVQPPSAGVAPPPTTPLGPGPYVTLLFSRTEMSAADNCVEDDDNIARLDTVVAPYLQSLGMAGTGTLVTKRTGDTARHCTHYGEDLTASWADATNLAQNYGWHFVSHTATCPGLAKIESLTPQQAYA
jgi:V8-like Glu-specific endopeptidase